MSSKNASCAEENRVYSHAYQILYDLLRKRYYILKQKFNLVADNQTLILQNIELFKENYLDKLIELKTRLANLNYTY
jgi:hypothetical protein